MGVMTADRKVLRILGTAIVLALIAGVTTWMLLGPSKGFSERFVVTFQGGGTQEVRTGPGYTKESLTQSPGPDQTAGPLWGRGVVSIDGPFDDQPFTSEHVDRETVAIRNALIVGMIALGGLWGLRCIAWRRGL